MRFSKLTFSWPACVLVMEANDPRDSPPSLTLSCDGVPEQDTVSSSQAGWTQFLRTGLELLFPQRCPLCQTPTNHDSAYPRFCSTCIQKLLTDPAEICSSCGGPVSDRAFSGSECAQCRGRQRLFDRAIPLGLYQHTLRDVVIRMKEPQAAALAAAIGHLMSLRVREILGNDVPQLFVFAPMHWRRRIRRRVNNAERLAEAVSRGMKTPVSRSLIACTRHTGKQSLLSVSQRRANVRGAFKVDSRPELEGIHVGLVDDTMTTGATANEISRVLRRAGVARVTLLLAARGVIG